MSTEIMNQALDLLEEEPILSMDDNRAAVRWMSRNYHPTRKGLLRLHPWNFAIKRALLSVEATAPSSGFRYGYALPSDVLKVLPLTYNGFRNGVSIHFAVEGRTLLTNSSGYQALRYVADVTDPNLFDSLFVEALLTKLAWRAASFITGKMNYVQLCQQAHMAALTQAQIVDSLEGTPERPEDDDWIHGRFGDYSFEHHYGASSLTLSPTAPASITSGITTQQIVASGALVIDYSLARQADISLVGNVTSFNVINWPQAGQLGRLILNVTNTGGFNITAWPPNTRSAGGVFPTLTAGAGSRDKFLLSTEDGGTTIDLDIVGQDYE